VSADRVQQAQLTDDDRTVEFVRQHKNPSTESPPAQFLRLVDAAVAMASKPYFHKPGGSVDVEKVLGRLQSDRGSAPTAHLRRRALPDVDRCRCGMGRRVGEQASARLFGAAH
jgi:hypothetical protein